MDAPRTRQQRIRDTLNRLEHDIDAWISTADPDLGTPYLIPLSFAWNGQDLLLSTAAATPTGRNLAATGTVHLAIGSTRDVVLIQGSVQVVPSADLPPAEAEQFASKTGFDPRGQNPAYPYFRVAPRRILAWREANEIIGRELMRDGRWLESSPR